MMDKQNYYKTQIAILEKHNLIYVAVHLPCEFSEEKQKFTKGKPYGLGEYKDVRRKKLEFKYGQHNAVCVMTGENYDGLILVDIDNCEDTEHRNTMDYWMDLRLKQDDLCDTLQSETINGGMHYYFHCTRDQREIFSQMSFTSSNHKLFGGCIDIKYTNQLSYECSLVEYNGDSFIYEFVDDFPILPLPEWIFEEIVRVKTSVLKNNKNVKHTTETVSSCTTSISTLRTNTSSPFFHSDDGDGEVMQREPPTQNETQHIPEEVNILNQQIRKNKDWDILVQLFDRCYKPLRFRNYDDWLHVGMAIKNRFGEKGLDLWKYFSDKAPIHDSEDQLRSKYDTFNEDYDRPVRIYTLYHFAKEDNKEEYLKVMKEKNAFGDFELTSTDIKHYIKQFKGHDFIWNNDLLYSFDNVKGYWIPEKEGFKMRSYIGEELYESLKEIYFQCYFDHMSADVRKKTEAKIVRLKTLPFQKEIVEKTKENLTNNDDIFDNKKYLLGFTNVVYDLELGQFRKYMRNDLVSMTTGYDWVEPTAEELNTMINLVESIIPNETERECYLRILATGLTGVSLEKFIIENGVGGNGKGLSNDQMLCSIGNYGMIGNNALLTEKRKMNANPECANLHKKRYVVFREPSCTDMFQNSAIRELTGGGNISARGLWDSKTTKKLYMTCVVECNKKPLFAEAPLPADIRRVIDIPFRNIFTDEEQKVNHALGIYRGNSKYKELNFQEQHRCAFLKIVMNAYARYADDQFDLKIPQSIKERTNEYLQLSCDLYQWILDNYEKTENMKEVVQIREEMYAKFKRSNFYENLTRADKRGSKYTEKGFVSQIKEMTFIEGHFFERKQIGDNHHRNILCGFKEKQTTNLLDAIIMTYEEE